MTVQSTVRRLAVQGGEPVRTRPWPTYDKGDVFVSEDDERAGARALASRLYFRYDYRPLAETECGRFERSLTEFFGCRHALAVSSGTAAIALALMALELPRGALVACPGFTFAATPSAILLAGGRPLLIEVDDDLNLDVGDLRRKHTPELKAIVVAHMRGFSSDMREVLAFADEVAVPVVEDAVPALGASLDGRYLGTWARAGAFSTQSDKSLNTGEGGFLLTDDTDLFARAVVLSGAYEGRVRRHCPATQVDDLALPLYSMRMDEIRAAVAASAMDRLALRVELLQGHHAYVAERLAELGGIAVRRPVAPDALLGEALLFRLPGQPPETASWFAQALCAEGVDARHLGSCADLNVRAFWNWRFLFPGEAPERIRARLPHTARMLDETIDIPLAPMLTKRDCDQLVAAVTKVAATLPASVEPSLA